MGTRQGDKSLCCSLLLGKAQQVGWPGWQLRCVGTLQIAMLLSSPSEEEREVLSARLPFSASVSHWSKFPSYINAPAFLGRFTRAHYKLLGKPHPVARYFS